MEDHTSPQPKPGCSRRYGLSRLISLFKEVEDMDPLEKGEKLLSLWDKLEDFFQRKVDLLTQKSLKNPFLLENIDKTKILLYDNERKEVFV